MHATHINYIAYDMTNKRWISIVMAKRSVFELVFVVLYIFAVRSMADPGESPYDNPSI